MTFQKTYTNVYLFLGYVPKTLHIDETTLQGKLFAHRIRHGYTYTSLAKLVGLDKSTLARFERGRNPKLETLEKVTNYLYAHEQMGIKF